MKEYTPQEVKYRIAATNTTEGEMALTYIRELEQINFRLQGENKQLKIDYNNLEKALSLCNASNSFNKEQLAKAKEIIRKYYKYNPSCEYSYKDIDNEAEQFLKEIE